MNPLLVSIASIRFYVRSIHTRFPFRYGSACLVATPLLHARVQVRGENGHSAEGVSADILAPRWFDKNPEKDYRQNIEDLIEAVREAAAVYLDESSHPYSCFEIWRRSYGRIMNNARSHNVPGLVAGCGSAFIERALVDATAKLAGRSFATTLRDGTLGFEAGTVHSELQGKSIEDTLPAVPTKSILVRHTVGFADPLSESDIAPSDRLDDGLPHSLEACISTYGLQRFKVKVNGDIESDRERLARMSRIFASCVSGDYRLTLDGNEQMAGASHLESWWNALRDDTRLEDLLQRVLFLEQPLDRHVALSTDHMADVRSLKGLPPMVIDESDDHLDAFKKAVELGYRGVTLKNCKGLFKGLLNHMLVDHYGKSRGDFVLSGEDLTNLPPVALQQDLCSASVHGLAHVERNGHHYVRGLDHLSKAEREACLSTHASLYEPFDGSARMRIVNGRLDLSSLHCEGFGVGIPIDFDSMTPLADWTFESLGLP